jgi:hypothetical protein
LIYVYRFRLKFLFDFFGTKIILVLEGRIPLSVTTPLGVYAGGGYFKIITINKE